MKSGLRIGVLLVTVAVIILLTRVFAEQPPDASGSNTTTTELAPVLLEGTAPLSPSRTEALIAELQKTINEHPDDVTSYAQLGAGYLQRARETGDPTYYNLAEQALDKALELAPNDVDALIGKGSLMLSRHEFADALALGEKVLTINSGKAAVYGMVADAQIELGRYDQAVDTIQKMVDLRPDLSSYARVSYARELHGDTEGAIIAMKQAVQAGGPNAENTNWCRVQLGNLYYSQGNLDAAEQSYKEALNSEPGYLHALAGMGKVAAARGDLTMAADYYTQATKIVPVPEYVAMLGDIYTKQGEADKAKKEYDLFAFIAQTYKANGMLFGVEGAMFFADRGLDLEQALAEAEAEGVTRKDIHTQDTIGWVLFKMGRYDAAWDHAQQATRLGTKDPLILYHAGMIAAQVGQPEKAKAYLQEALDLNPRFHVLHADEAATELANLQ